MNQDKKKTRYVVLPGSGTSGPAMQSAVFKGGGVGGAALKQAVSLGLNRFQLESSNAVVANASLASAELAGSVLDQDFEVISQRFDNGPALVAMTQAARLALEASHPDVRVLPVTRYYLPGQRPGQSKRARKDARTAGPAGAVPGGPAATVPAGASAIGTGGVIFDADAKQHFLGGSIIGGDGTGVTVGVIDTGIDNTHPALATAVAALRCYIPGVNAAAGGPVDWGAASKDRAGHGTHVAGIIAARPGQGGPAGVAPNAKVISYRVFPDNKSGPKGAENPAIISSILAAINDDCHIVNLSLEGSGLKDDGVRSAISDAWNQGMICVAAAGNGFGNPVSFPAALPHCVAVTAIGRDGAFPNTPAFSQFVSNQRSAIDPPTFLASFSNFGPQVQFTAPGHAIVSTFPGNGWWIDSGTSMAAPFIVGILARLLSANGNILGMAGNAARSAAMMQMLVSRAKVLQLPQSSQEGYGLPV